ncbi:MAG TPA: 50S ribosomal protein L18 [Bacteroidota bacterium]|nr:50S ribosomal protein L18 [Bacteroidota bacterium]
MIHKKRNEHRIRLKTRIARKIRLISRHPRLTVFRSSRHIYAQIIDDTQSKTIAMASTLSKDLKDELKNIKDRKEKAKRVGISIANKALSKNVKTVVFDRSGYLYHGVVKSLADGAREGGLEF